MNACFALNALSFLVVINTLMMLRVKHIPPAKSGRMQEELEARPARTCAITTASRR